MRACSTVYMSRHDNKCKSQAVNAGDKPVYTMSS